MNTKLGFILGRESDLSKAEIFAVLSKKEANFEIIYESREVLILKLEKNPTLPISELGGTIKIFELVGSGIEKSDVKSFIKSNIGINQSELRVNFGISGYGRIEKDYIYRVGKTLKNEMLEGGLKARFVTGKYKDLTSVIVNENKLLERGFEVILVENNGRYFIGRTLEVQDYKFYSKIDYGRPKRDEKSGMLPPKLAQIMINIAGKKTDSIIYDPFCGSGTILQEAILLGYIDIFGSDISEKAIADSKENLDWLGKQGLNSRASLAMTDLFVSDILNPSKPIKADLIVCEGYLGEPIRRNVQTAKNDAVSMADFYLRTLTNLGEMLKINGKIVIAVPFYIIGKEKVFLPLTEKLHLTGLKISDIPHVRPNLRQTLLYSRPDSFVGREIFVLEKIT